MSDDPSDKLAVLVHHNNEVSVFDERGLPRLCRDCRLSGWLTEYERQTSPEPVTCLLYSGGADVLQGDRVIYDDVRKKFEDYGEGRRRHEEIAQKARDRFPQCWTRNSDGKCSDYVKAKTLPWWGNIWKKLRSREWRTRKMRE